MSTDLITDGTRSTTGEGWMLWCQQAEIERDELKPQSTTVDGEMKPRTATTRSRALKRLAQHAESALLVFALLIIAATIGAKIAILTE